MDSLSTRRWVELCDKSSHLVSQVLKSWEDIRVIIKLKRQILEHQQKQIAENEKKLQED